MPPKPVKSPKKPRTRLRAVSEKYRPELDRYHRETKPRWLADHPTCQFIENSEICGKACGVTAHHKRGRGKYLNDTQHLMTVCGDHHHYIHFVNPNDARRRGYLGPK